MRRYQCLKCGMVLRTKREVIMHLKEIEKVDDLVIDYYYQSFSFRRLWW
jgi:hypothetical protein